MPKPSEADLEGALLGLYRQWGAHGYWAKRFCQLFSPHCKRYAGGVAAVRRVLAAGETTGLAFLRNHDLLDLSVESLVLKPQWGHLFDDADRALAKAKLRR